MLSMPRSLWALPRGFHAQLMASLMRSGLSPACKHRRSQRVPCLQESLLAGMLIEQYSRSTRICQIIASSICRYFQETGSNCPSTLPHDQQKALCDLAVASAKCLGFQMGVLHTELKYTSHGPHLIEVSTCSLWLVWSQNLYFSYSPVWTARLMSCNIKNMFTFSSSLCLHSRAL